MAGAPAAESEPLFILEPLPELSNVIDSFFEANPLLLLAGAGLMIYLLVKIEDPVNKLWAGALLNLGLDYHISGSMFYAMIFTAIFVFTFSLVWAAIRWEDVKAALGIDKARIISIISFIVATYVLMVLGAAIGMPAGPGVVICGLTTAYLWWSYYSLEPATA